MLRYLSLLTKDLVDIQFNISVVSKIMIQNNSIGLVSTTCAGAYFYYLTLETMRSIIFKDSYGKFSRSQRNRCSKRGFEDIKNY